ncbi:hypothetical protein AAKU55_000226 [Oxalobacteraceae bacterium GrIS 1.11]
MTPASAFLRLPFHFDVARMQGELEGIGPQEWSGHFNTQAYENGWSCVALRSVDGQAGHIIPIEGARYADTPVLARCPYLRQVIRRFACEKTAIRLMALAAGAMIREHRDAGTALEQGHCRLHIPIQTSPAVRFRIDGADVHFSAGQAWYMDASCLHGVENRSDAARIHLVLDCLTNAWLERLFRRAGFVGKPKPRYDDPAINDANVGQVIALLQATGTAASLALAQRLDAASRA